MSSILFLRTTPGGQSWKNSKKHLILGIEPGALTCKACIPTLWAISLTQILLFTRWAPYKYDHSGPYFGSTQHHMWCWGLNLSPQYIFFWFYSIFWLSLYMVSSYFKLPGHSSSYPHLLHLSLALLLQNWNLKRTAWHKQVPGLFAPFFWPGSHLIKEDRGAEILIRL